MKKVRLGRTNLIVTQLGWGGIPIQRVAEQEAVSVVRAVVEMGVDLLDTARSYSTSEYRVGLALREINRPVTISSKSQVRTDKIYDEVKESLRQLQVKKVNIYQLHAVSTFEEYEKIMTAGGAYEGLKRARDEGLIDHIGISSHNLSLLERVIEEGYYDVIMACYSFLEPDAAQKVFPLAKAHDIGILAMKSFSGGVIEEPGPALRFVLSMEGVVTIPGMETVEKARENWRIFTEGGALTEQDMKRIEAIRKNVDRQFCRRCDYCQPCTQEIKIQLALGLKTIIKRVGPEVEGKGWLRELIEKARTCSECGECLKRCPYELPIPDLIKENVAWYDKLKSQ